jgi:putative ABC transport system permease protein
MRALWLEFSVIGILVGLLSALASGTLGAVLAWKLFDLPGRFDPTLLGYGLAAGLLLTLILVPWLGARITRASPVTALRG